LPFIRFLTLGETALGVWRSIVIENVLCIILMVKGLSSETNRVLLNAVSQSSLILITAH
jgi:heme exporter protein D